MSDLSDLLIEAKSAAVQRIVDTFTHPDDLIAKFPAFRAKIKSEKATIDSQLKSALDSQLEDAQRGLGVLLDCKGQTKLVDSNLSKINSLLSNTVESVENYSKIMQVSFKIIYIQYLSFFQVSKTHQNFVATRDLVNQFQALDLQIKRCRYFLEKDSADMLGDHANLLVIHYQLHQLHAFKVATIRRSKNAAANVVNTLNDYFHRVERLWLEFEQYFWELAKKTLPLIKAGKTSVIVRIVKIIETEEKEDEKAASESIHQADGTERVIKAYRIKYFDVLRVAISDYFNSLYLQYKDDLVSFLSGVDVVMDDLVLIYDELVPRFPRRYNIFQFFVLEYHRIIYEVLNRVVQGQMEGGAILQLLKWVRDYYDNMSGRLGVGEDLLEPRLLDGKQADMITQYIKIVRTKLMEWIKTLLDRETKEFLEREFAPETDADGFYVMSGSVIMFQMFNQQLDVVSTSSRGPLLVSVIRECLARVDEYLKHWGEAIESEYKKFESKGGDIAQGLPEYIIALANDCYRSTEFSETLVEKLETIADEPYKSEMEELIRSYIDGFLKLAKRAYTTLIDIAILDCKPATSQMYLQGWYDQDLMRLIIGTLEDYCADFQQFLTSHLFSKLMTDLIDRFALVYLECLKNKGGKFKMPMAKERMRADFNMAIEFFSQHKTEKRVRQSLDVIDKTQTFIEANARLALVEFYNLWKSYPDIPYTFIEDLIWKRDDLEKASAKEILASVKDKMKEETKEPPPTIFSKMAKK